MSKCPSEDEGQYANRGVSTNPCVCVGCSTTKDNPSPKESEPLKVELRNVINLMGPDTPHVAPDEDTVTFEFSTTTPLPPPESKENKSVPNTPKDFSELTSFPTDTVDVYFENRRPSVRSTKCAGCTYRDTGRKEPCPGPIRKLSSLFQMKNAPFAKKPIGSDHHYNRKQAGPLDLYKINILQPENDHSPPRRVVFDLVDELPKPEAINASTSVSEHFMRNVNFITEKEEDKKLVQGERKNVYKVPSNTTSKYERNVCDRAGNWQKRTYYEKRQQSFMPIRCSNLNDMTRVDVYYFDHGNSAYYHTTDSPPVIMTEIIAERTDTYTTRFWAEIFGTINIGFSFFTSFILQLFRFILQSLIRPLVIGLIQMLSDYLFKPFLATIFNAVLQPPLIFIFNVATSLRDICDPLASGLGYFLRELATICRAIRLVEIRKEIKCGCEECIKRRYANVGCNPENYEKCPSDGEKYSIHNSKCTAVDEIV